MIKKYKLQTAFMVLGFTISLTMLYYMTYYNFYENSIDEDRIRYSLNYSKDIMCSVDSEKSVQELINAQIDNVKISIKEVAFYVDDLGVTQMNIEILICNDTSFAYPPMSRNKKNSGILLGRSYKKSLKGKSDIKIGGDTYRIGDYINSNKSGLYDYSIVINGNEIGNNTLKRLMLQKNAMNIYIESDRLSEEEIKSSIYPELEKIGVKILYENDQEEEFERTNDYDSILIIGYSFLMILLVMYFWTNNRMYEFAVRKAFGESSLHIIFGLLSDLTHMFILSIFIAGLLIIFNSFLSDEPIKLNDSIPISLMVWIFDYISCMLMAIIIPVIKLLRFNPVDILIKHKEV